METFSSHVGKPAFCFNLNFMGGALGDTRTLSRPIHTKTRTLTHTRVQKRTHTRTNTHTISRMKFLATSHSLSKNVSLTEIVLT